MHNEDINKKVELAYRLIKEEKYPTKWCSYTTAAGTYNNGIFLFPPSVLHDECQAKQVLYKHISDENDITNISLAIYINSIEPSLIEAREILINKILETDGNPLLEDKEKVIVNMGKSLDKQVGKDNDNIDKSNNNIYANLKNLNLHKENSYLYSKYESIHRFYNASKHGNKTQFKDDEIELSKPEGKKITISYYEVTRQIFEWYYTKRNCTIPNYLSRINYSDYPDKFGYNIPDIKY